MRANWIIALLLIGLLIPSVIYGQDKKPLRNVDIYEDLGGGTSLIFLKGLGAKIDSARYSQNAKALCAFSALLYYAERIAGKRHADVDGVTLLREATLIAWTEKDIPALRVVAGVFRSKVFGPGDVSGAEEIEEYITKLSKKKEEEPVVRHPKKVEKKHIPASSAQAYLVAEEAAKTDAKLQLAERIYGVMIDSLTDFKDFEIKKDVVIATLERSLLFGIQYKTLSSDSREIKVEASISRDFVVRSVKRLYEKQGKKMDEFDQKRLERRFYKKTLTAVGSAAIR